MDPTRWADTQWRTSTLAKSPRRKAGRSGKWPALSVQKWILSPVCRLSLPHAQATIQVLPKTSLRRKRIYPRRPSASCRRLAQGVSVRYGRSSSKRTPALTPWRRSPKQSNYSAYFRVIIKKSVQSILNEKEILCSLYSPFIVNMKCSFQDRENLYLVLDYLTGGDLRYHLCSKQSFSEEESST